MFWNNEKKEREKKQKILKNKSIMLQDSVCSLLDLEKLKLKEQGMSELSLNHHIFIELFTLGAIECMISQLSIKEDDKLVFLSAAILNVFAKALSYDSVVLAKRIDTIIDSFKSIPENRVIKIGFFEMNQFSTIILKNMRKEISDQEAILMSKDTCKLSDLFVISKNYTNFDDFVYNSLDEYIKLTANNSNS